MTEAAAPASTAPQATPSSPSKLVPLLLVLNLGASGFVAFKTATAHPLVAGGHEAAVHEPAAPGAAITGPVVTVDPFVVNLNEEGSSRFLKVTFDLEMTSADAAAELTKSKRLVRDEILRYLSGLTVAQTLGEENRTKIRDELQARADKLLGGGRVRRVFFTEFVVQ
jgi:flagellar FliL protein